MAKAERVTDGRRVAVGLLEVLAGVKTPASASAELGISLTHYYHLEARALGALVAACEPRTRGRQATPERRVAELEKDRARLEKELARQQALTRAAQRSLELKRPVPARPREKPKAGGRRQRRPVVRALEATKLLGSPPEATGEG